MNAQFIYDATAVFHESQWKEFTRLKLGFSDTEIREMEDGEKSFAELKHKTVRKWIGDDVETEYMRNKLTSLKQEYFFSRSEFSFSNPMKAQGDLVGEKPVEKPRYTLAKKKGIALIISNSFDGNGSKFMSRTPGSDVDLENMKKLWNKIIGCELVDGKVHRDKTADEMRGLLKNAGEAKDYDYAVVVISTHGGFVPTDEQKAIDPKTKQETTLKKYEEVLYGNDGSYLKASEVQNSFCNKEAQSLRDIPKLIILQYCRGETLDEGVPRDATFKVEERDSTDADSYKQQKTEESFPEKDSLMPALCDIITVYATHQSYMALRNRKKGSWIIQHISEVFQNHYKTKHVIDMITLVNDLMKNRKGDLGNNKECKAMSIYESSLTKDFYLY
uniref:caspase-2-like n=1 Tax=Styela clava TaxID=7725 RepID=UPI00193A6CC4|nr:caspase-2-like [Styela clava]